MDTSLLIFIIFIGLILLLVILYFLLRWIFSVKRQLWNQKQMIALLLMLVEKQVGATPETATIAKINNNPNEEIQL